MKIEKIKLDNPKELKDLSVFDLGRLIVQIINATGLSLYELKYSNVDSRNMAYTYTKYEVKNEKENFSDTNSCGCGCSDHS